MEKDSFSTLYMLVLIQWKMKAVLGLQKFSPAWAFIDIRTFKSMLIQETKLSDVEL